MCPPQATGSWTLSMWVRVLNPPDGTMRTLFYKGAYDGSRPNRSPSAWLLPDCNRLTLRVSTSESDDVGTMGLLYCYCTVLCCEYDGTVILLLHCLVL